MIGEPFAAVDSGRAGRQLGLLFLFDLTIEVALEIFQLPLNLVFIDIETRRELERDFMAFLPILIGIALAVPQHRPLLK